LSGGGKRKSTRDFQCLPKSENGPRTRCCGKIFLQSCSFFSYGGFELVIYSKKVNAEAELALAQAVKLDKQEGPQREAARQKKEADALEVTRLKNQKSFRP
jgi:hypothetical protein